MINLENINKSFGKNQILYDVNIQFHKGQISGLIGPSGSCKTSIIECIIGAMKPDTGKITLNEEKIPNKKFASQVGYMPQEDALYLDLTAKENLHFFAALQGMNKKESKQRIKELLEFLKLENTNQKLVYDFSGGMKKRLSLAIALLNNPKYLILDEPTVGIDPVLKREIWKLLETLKNNGCMIILSTHVMEEAQKCDYCTFVYNGKILTSNKTKTLLDENNNDLESLFFKGEEDVTNN